MDRAAVATPAAAERRRRPNVHVRPVCATIGGSSLSRSCSSRLPPTPRTSGSTTHASRSPERTGTITQYVDGICRSLGGEVIERVDARRQRRELHRRSSPRRSARDREEHGGRSRAARSACATRRRRQRQRRSAARLARRRRTSSRTSRSRIIRRGDRRAAAFASRSSRDHAKGARLRSESGREAERSVAARSERFRGRGARCARTRSSICSISTPTGMLAGPNVQIVDTDAPSHAARRRRRSRCSSTAASRSSKRSTPTSTSTAAQRYMQSLGYTGARRIVGYSIPVDPHALARRRQFALRRQHHSGPGQALLRRRRNR